MILMACLFLLLSSRRNNCLNAQLISNVQLILFTTVFMYINSNQYEY